MIINAEQQSAEEMARRARIKGIRRGLVDYDVLLPMSTLVRKSTEEYYFF